MSQHDTLTLRDALRNIQYEAASLADAQVIALQALNATYPARAALSATQPAQAAQGEQETELKYWQDRCTSAERKWGDLANAQAAQPAQKPCARLHITATDTYPDIDVEVLDGAHLQPSMSPVDVYTIPPAAAQPAVAQGAGEVVAGVREALEFYANGGHEVELHGKIDWVAERGRLHDRGFHHVCEAYSGSETFVECGQKAQAALALMDTQPAAGADTSNASLKVTRTLIAANKANAILRLALKELRAALDPDDWMGELPMQTFVDHILKQADAAYDEAAAGADVWKPMSMAPSQKTVLLAVRNECGRVRTVLARHVNRHTEVAGEDDQATEYRESDDTHYVTPGWYESNTEAEINYGITGEFLGWMNAPKWVDAAIAASGRQE